MTSERLAAARAATAAAKAEAAASAKAVEAAARGAEEVKAAARAAREAAERAAAEGAEIEMAMKLSDYIGGGLERRRQIVREAGLLQVGVKTPPTR